MARFRSDGTPVGENEGDLFNEEDFLNSSEYARTRGGRVSDADEVLADIPIVNWLTGASSRRDAARGESEAARNRAYWDQLTDYMPTADDLAVDYAMEDFVPGGESEWASISETDAEGMGSMRDALGAFREFARGGLTDTDRAMMDEASRGEAMRARADREAAMSAAEARGMGGSGTALMARMGSDEAAHARALGMHTDMLAAAQQRQYDATRAMADMGRGLTEADDRKASALDAWNARESDYARDLEGRNTERENRSRESRSDANQSAYENRERAVSGATGQYSTDVSRRGAAGRREDEQNQAGAGAIGALITELVG